MKDPKFAPKDQSVLIKNPNRLVNSLDKDPYVPEYQRLASSGKLPGFANEEELIKHQADLQARVRQEAKMAPKISVPNVGSRDIAWRQGMSTFYDEPLASQAIHDENLVREDLSIEELEEKEQKVSKGNVSYPSLTKNHSNQLEEHVLNSTPKVEKKSKRPTSLDQLDDEEIVVIIDGEVVFTSLLESEVSSFILDCLLQEKVSSLKNILVIKKLPIKISVNLK